MSEEAEAMLRSIGKWCEPDRCPTWICGGPHIEVPTSLGVEILRPDQTPLGRPLEARE